MKEKIGNVGISINISRQNFLHHHTFFNTTYTSSSAANDALHTPTPSMTMTMRSKADATPRHRKCPAILLLVRRPLLLLQLVLIFVCHSRSSQRQRFCVVDAFGVGGAARHRIAIPLLGNIYPSPATKTTPSLISSATLGSINHHHTCHRRLHCNRPTTTIMMSANQQQQEQEQLQHRLVKISSISSPEILDNYDTFLLDMWGGKDLSHA